MGIDIQKKVSLAKLTTFRLGGAADYFTEVSSLDELTQAISWAKRNSQPIFILAGGSNVIFSENGFSGLVIKLSIESIDISGNQITVGSAVTMKELVDFSINHSLAGLEWAGGLPGSVGGAIRGNAGAFGGEIKDNIASVVSVNTDSLKQRTWQREECNFEYRHSIFKELGNEVVISATFSLVKGDKKELREIANSRINYRQEKHPMEYPNSGSIFKNTPIEKIPPDVLEQWQESIKNDPFPVVPTARIISDAGLAGTKFGGAQLSTKHTNYIVNISSATGEDVYELIKQIRFAVFDKYGIELEVEPELVGFS